MAVFGENAFLRLYGYKESVFCHKLMKTLKTFSELYCKRLLFGGFKNAKVVATQIGNVYKTMYTKIGNVLRVLLKANIYISYSLCLMEFENNTHLIILGKIAVLSAILIS